MDRRSCTLALAALACLARRPRTGRSTPSRAAAARRTGWRRTATTPRAARNPRNLSARSSAPATRCAPIRVADGCELVVNVRGVHRLERALVLDERDSGSPGHEVVWRSAPGASAVVSGAMRVVELVLARQREEHLALVHGPARVPPALRQRNARDARAHGAISRRLRTHRHRVSLRPARGHDARVDQSDRHRGRDDHAMEDDALPGRGHSRTRHPDAPAVLEQRERVPGEGRRPGSVELHPPHPLREPTSSWTSRASGTSMRRRDGSTTSRARARKWRAPTWNCPLPKRSSTAAASSCAPISHRSLPGFNVRPCHVAGTERPERLRRRPERLPSGGRRAPAQHHGSRPARRAHARQRALRLRAPHHVRPQHVQASRRRRARLRDRQPGQQHRRQPFRGHLVGGDPGRRRRQGRPSPDVHQHPHPRQPDLQQPGARHRPRLFRRRGDHDRLHHALRGRAQRYRGRAVGGHRHRVGLGAARPGNQGRAVQLSGRSGRHQRASGARTTRLRPHAATASSTTAFAAS